MVLARLVYVLQPLRTDEGGYLLVARQWHSSGEFIYGDYHVDRPPLLMLIYRVAALSDWDPLIRVVAVPFALIFVVAAWRAGELLGGALGARWSAVVAAGLMCSPAMASDQADGELFAASLVMAAVALGLTAWRSASDPGRAHRLAAAAGLFAGAAPLVKQNFVEGLVFLAILLAAAAWQHRRVGPREVVVGLGAMGAAVAWRAALRGLRVAGFDVAEQPIEAKRRLAIVPDDPMKPYHMQDVITRVVDDYLISRGPIRYAHLNEAIGALSRAAISGPNLSR